MATCRPTAPSTSATRPSSSPSPTGSASRCAPASRMTARRMTIEAPTLRVPRRLADGHVLPVLAVVAIILVVWYLAAIWLNAPQIIDRLNGIGPDWPTPDLPPGPRP